MHTADSQIFISVNILYTYNMLLFNYNNELVLQLPHTWMHTLCAWENVSNWKVQINNEIKMFVFFNIYR